MTTTCPPPNQPSSEAKAGVAIILSPELTIQWKSSKKQKKIMRGEVSIGDTTRFLSISMSFETKTNQKKTETIPSTIYA
jgi:hypothetical protein